MADPTRLPGLPDVALGVPVAVISLAAAWLHALPAPAAEILVDATEAAGIAFVHESGAAGEKHLVEILGSGAAWLDHDGDGNLDLYIVQGHSDPGNARQPGREANVLYRNRGDGTFEDVTARAGVGDRGYGFGAAVGDIDGDGDPDLYITNFGRNTLYRNNGDGTFTDITGPSGVGCPLWSTGAAFADLDGDGVLDLYVANYLDYRTDLDRACRGNRLNLPEYCHPNRFDSAPDALYRGLGDGRFEEIGRKAGIAIAGRFVGKSLGVLPTDVDGDGDTDILVACDAVPDILWRNLGDGTFQDAALDLGTALDPEGIALGGRGIDGGDINGDGVLDYLVTNSARETSALYLGDASGYFYEGSSIVGLAPASLPRVGFGCKIFDYDLDGDLDIYVSCGHVSDLVETLHPGSGERFAQRDLLFENGGAGKFREVAAESGSWLRRRLVGRGAAFGDIDNDGDTDGFIVNRDGPGVLLRNDRRNRNHWIGLALEGDGHRVHRDAVGARVTVISAAGIRRVFEVRSAGSYLSASDPRVVCGLGTEASIRSVAVTWPDGLRESFENLEVDRYHRVVHGTGERAGKGDKAAERRPAAPAERE